MVAFEQRPETGIAETIPSGHSCPSRGCKLIECPSCTIRRVQQNQVARGESSRLISLVMLLNIKQNYFVVVCILFTVYLGWNVR